MSVFKEDLSAALENSRNSLRRIARHNDTEFSKQSILNDMERFVKTVNVMDETVLVPCRLIDLPRSGDDDLFCLYAMLNDLKTELLWSRGEADPERPERPRRASTASAISALETVCADSDSESSSAGGDSGLETEDDRESAARAAAACRRHLRGLRRSLRHLTGAAVRLTRSYQDDVGGPA